MGALLADGGDLAVPEELTEHAARNRESWAKEAASYVAGAERNWAAEEITWGILDVPESEVQAARRRRRARTSSSSAAAPRTSRRGSRGGARGSSAST